MMPSTSSTAATTLPRTVAVAGDVVTVDVHGAVTNSQKFLD
jgi:hypothetical protein